MNLYLSRGLQNLRMNDSDGFFKDIEIYIRLNKDGTISNSEAYALMGGRNYILNDLQSALKNFDKSIELDTNNASAYYERGQLKRTLGLEEEGLIDLMTAETLGYEEDE